MFHASRLSIVAAIVLGLLSVGLAASQSGVEFDAARSDAQAATAPATAGAADAAVPEAVPRRDDGSAKPSRKLRVRVTISKETTAITEPLRDDGYPDYIAALNRIASQGVTPENNAAVLLWRAFGPKEISVEVRERFFALLGVPVLPEQGDYFIPIDEFAEAHPELVPKVGKAPREETAEGEGADEEAGEPDESARVWEAYNAALERPWTARQSPLMSAWLEANAKPLDLLVEASRRPKCYNPLVATDSDPMLIGVLLPAARQSREAARLLRIRAMLGVGEGNLDAAWEDLLAMHRLARLQGRGQTIIDTLVCLSIDGAACDADAWMLASRRLSAAAALKMREQLRAIPIEPRMIDRIDIGERWMYCDGVCYVVRTGRPQVLALLAADTENGGLFERIRDQLVCAAIDWDTVLRMGNEWYDRMVEAGRRETWAQRREAFDEIDRELREHPVRSKDPKRLALAFLQNPRQAPSKMFGEMFAALMLPPMKHVCAAEQRGIARRAVLETGFALAAYRTDERKYPARLDQLVPKYVDRVPEDRFSGASLVYRPKSKGYVLYSVGPNMQDDGGRGLEDREGADNAGEWDDIVLRMPPSKPAK